ncbi:hypothetical protein F7725_028182 [Dissostichus mawsoni]|uniref:Trafficking protein particle complex 8 n=1 Tax=Dissostichus mawsoni TaxID=36200 RepID=A0A7J5XF53_DISMA|nr:hypothetical protein F7725_028182 [Dissostichus mawsoni]
MAQCVQSVQEFVQDSFVPMVAVLCSEEAERVTRKNNLSFAELLRPFCRLTSEGCEKSANLCEQRGDEPKLPIYLQPPQRRMLNEVVLSCQPQEGAATNVITAGDYDLNFSDHSLKASLPWYSAWRETLSEVSTSQHYTGLLVVSSTEAVPVEQFLKLSQEQHRVQHSGDYTNPKWFIPNTLKYYVLLHDMSEGDEQRADSVYEDMKQRYGHQGCYLLKMNSRTISAEEDEQIPDPWSQYLHRNNLQNQTEHPAAWRAPLQLTQRAAREPAPLSAANTELKKAAPEGGGCREPRDGLLPHIEKNIRQLNDQFSLLNVCVVVPLSPASLCPQLVSRKGLSRSLFTATKKWFGGGKAPEKSISEPKSTCGLLYPPEAPELQIRKMADLCFLVQHYELAYSCYHTAKKDFLSDQAMLYAAGALEMAAVSAFLQAGAPRPYPAHYWTRPYRRTEMSASKTCYTMNMVLAERCALLSAEILKSQVKYSEAATLLIKMTSEDSDLRSALLLEQAAHCFINMRNPMVRKFAFHMILAGHRFSKAGQRRHALRCYCQAMQVYKERGWSLAEDHINFTIGRQSFTLSQPENAVTAFRQILTNDSKQTATQQGAFLREYLYVYKSVIGGKEDSLPQLPLPCIHSSATRVYFGHERRLAEGEKQAATHVSLDQEYDQDQASMWSHLEEQLVASANRGPIVVEVSFRNPLKVPLALSNLSLLWSFTAEGTSPSEENAEEAITNEETLTQGMKQKDDIVTTEIILEFHLGPEETKLARLRLLPHRIGQLNIVGVVYNLAAASSGETAPNTEGSEDPGPTIESDQRGQDGDSTRSGSASGSHHNTTHAANGGLLPAVPTALLCGEIRKAYVEFCNVSGVALSGLRVASTHPDFFTFGSQTTTPLTPVSPTSAENCSAYKTLATPRQPGSVATEVLVSAGDFSQPSGVMDIPIEGSTLQPGESTQLPLWLRGPDQEGVHEINFLFYYESTEKGNKISHRVLRHTVFICASRSLSVKASACRSSGPPHQSLEDQGSGGTLVFIDVENINTVRYPACHTLPGVREFHIIQVSSSSQHWRLHKCINPAKDKDCKLTSRERAKLCFRATPCKPQATSNAVQKYTFADLNLGNERIISSSTPCGDFFFRGCRSAEVQPVEAPTSRTTASSRSQVCVPTADIGNIVKKCNELDLNLIVIWKAYVVEDNKQLILEGQLHVALQTIGKEATSLTPKEETQEMVLLKFKSEAPPPVILPAAELSQLIKTNLHYPETYTHPFVQDSSGKNHTHLLGIKPKLSLTYRSLCVVPSLSPCPTAPWPGPESVEVHSSFTWVGQTQHHLQLRPQEVLCLTLRACFLQPGVYNLNTPRVFAKLTDQGAMCETSQQTASPALIIINSA